MELEAGETEAWQRYFTGRRLRQPFPQMWEPVADPAELKPDRFAGCVLPRTVVQGREKDGITAIANLRLSTPFFLRLGDPHGSPSSGSVRYTFTTPPVYDRNREYVKLCELECKVFDGWLNRAVWVLDRITLPGRIKMDDVSVLRLMDRYPLARIEDFISLARDARAFSVLAALLEYEKERFGDRDPLADFALN
jgi:hypothetical protein